MRKVICLMSFLMFFVTGLSCALATEVLFIVGNSTALIAGDKALRDHLSGRGYSVIIKQQNKFEASDVLDHDLVVVSNSVTLASVGTILQPLAVPVVCAEPTLFDNLGMTGKVANIDYGTVANQQTVVAVASALTPLSGTVAVSSTNQPMVWGKPNRNAVIGAYLATDTTHTKATLFAYKEGATMPGVQKAPDRRVGVFMSPAMPTTLTAAGWQLFDNALDYALLPEEEGCAMGEHAIKLASTCDTNIWVAASGNNTSVKCTTSADCGGGECLGTGANKVCKESRCTTSTDCPEVNSFCNTLNPNFTTVCKTSADCNTGARESCANTGEKSYYNSLTNKENCTTDAQCAATHNQPNAQCYTDNDANKGRCYFYQCGYNQCYYTPVPVAAANKTSTVCTTSADCAGGKFCYASKGGAAGTTGVCASVPTDGNGWAVAAGVPDKKICVPANWKGRFWARTGCTITNDGPDVLANCDTGTCLGGSTGNKNALHCLLSGAPNVTAAEFALPAHDSAAPTQYYDVSMVDAANVGIQIIPDPETYNITNSNSIGNACKTNADCPKAYNWVCDTTQKKCVNRYSCGAPGCVDTRCDQYGAGGKYLAHSKWAGKDSGHAAVSKAACPAELELANTAGTYVACLNAGKACTNFGRSDNASLKCADNLSMYLCNGINSGSCLSAAPDPNCCGCASWTKGYCTAGDNKKWQAKAGVYATIFHNASPTSYAFPYDDDISTFTCIGKSVDVETAYTVNFCPRPGIY